MNLRRKLSYLALLLVGLVLACELGVSSYFYWKRRSVTECFFKRGPAPILQFDKRLGFRFCEGDIEKLMLNDGGIEYHSRPHGNELGFLDRDNPQPRRRDDTTFRIAVLGDSFTCASFLDTNWPDRAERLAAESGFALELINCAQDGGGLANWAAVVENLLVADKFEIDGLLFAVFEDDLTRRLMLADVAGDGSVLLGRAPGWDPAGYPQSRGAALDLMRPVNVRVVAPTTFARIAQTGRPPFRPVLFDGARILLPLLWAEPDKANELSSPARQALLARMTGQIKDRGWPCLVAYLPRNLHMSPPANIVGIENYYPPVVMSDLRQFAQRLSAATLDGSGMHHGLSREEALALWFPHDGHWNEKGSDRFAEFVLPYLKRWAELVKAGETKPPPATDADG